MSFRDSAIKSAQLYVDYLEKNGGGTIEYRVLEISLDAQSGRENEYWLKMDQKLKNIDSLQVRIHAHVFSTAQIKPVVFDEFNRRLKVSLGNDSRDVFSHVSPNQVIVFSDLKFLVKRVGSWYENFGYGIGIPSGKQSVLPADCSKLGKEPSADQKQAISSILEKPFTYVWGAPGTGKTQFVLARAVLAYIQAGKKVLVAAPTNNAVEQTLYGLLPVLKEAGLDYNRLVIRLGVANAGFLEKYPGVCEDSGYNKAISEVLDRIQSLIQAKETAEKNERLFKEYQAFQNSFAEYTNASQQLDILFPQLIEAAKNTIKLNATISVKKSEMAKVNAEMNEAYKSQKFYNQSAKELLNRMNKPLYRLHTRSKRNSDKSKLDSYLDRARYYEGTFTKLKDEFGDLSKKTEQIKKDFDETHSSFIALRSAVADCVHFSAELSTLAAKLSDNDFIPSFNNFSNALTGVKRKLTSQAKKYTSVENLSLDSLKKELQQIEQQIKTLKKAKEELEQAEPGKRIEECLVIACTIDTCLNRFPLTEKPAFEHVFLDEAGYSSLIKAVTLTAYADRVTFLGDHMQLPPVCEASVDQIKQEPWQLIAFWAQSALYTETVFSKTAVQICCDYLQKKPIPFDRMVKFDLLLSYRFGESLARVLADDVYDSSFKGNNEHNTRILYIDAPKRNEPIRRINHSECDAIYHALLKDSQYKESYGIIAPYKKQVALLKQMAQKCHLPQDSAITIHQSQGREWDNVFLSVTDTSDKYFTNSLNPVSDGKRIINTAVSRARKNLIIVCDYHYWIRQEGQLIKKLLTIAEKLEY